MSHPEQQAFFALVADANRDLVSAGRVLEIGSYDVNGSIRRLFAPASDYVGVDLKEGPGVDAVAYGHEYDERDRSFDVTISGECFEHDPHWQSTLANMVRLTRAGGIVAFTCASRGRPEHGTRRRSMFDSPGTQAVGIDYYRNLTADDIAGLPLDEWFESWSTWYMSTSFDLYFAGIRAGAPKGAGATLPRDTDVAAIRQLMPAQHRAVRVPLRVVGRVVGYDETYQRAILPYWLWMQRHFAGFATRTA